MSLYVVETLYDFVERLCMCLYVVESLYVFVCVERLCMCLYVVESLYVFVFCRFAAVLGAFIRLCCCG
jgi:hypothetical protein